jgi:hypothetical protein
LKFFPFAFFSFLFLSRIAPFQWVESVLSRTKIFMPLCPHAPNRWEFTVAAKCLTRRSRLWFVVTILRVPRVLLFSKKLSRSRGRVTLCCKDVACAGLSDLEKTPGLNAAAAKLVCDF